MTLSRFYIKDTKFYCLHKPFKNKCTATITCDNCTTIRTKIQRMIQTWSQVRFRRLCKASFGTLCSRLLDKDNVCKEGGNACLSTCTRQFWSRSRDVRLLRLENAPSPRTAIRLSPRNMLRRFGLAGRLGHSSISLEWRLSHWRCRNWKYEMHELHQEQTTKASQFRVFKNICF